MGKDFEKISRIKNGTIKSKTKIKYEKGKKFTIEKGDEIIFFYKKGKFWYDGKTDDGVQLANLWAEFECDSCGVVISKKIYNLRERPYILCNNCSSFFASHSCERSGDKNPMSNKSIQKRLNLSEEEAKKYFSGISLEAKLLGKDVNTRLYWEKAGYNEEEITQILAEKRPQSKQYWLKMEYSEEESIYLARSNNASTVEYYQERGYENAEKSRQDFINQHNSNSLEKFKEKYGIEYGEEKYFKWRRNSSENNKFHGYSNISQDLFWSLHEILNGDYEHIFFKKLNKEYNLRSDKKLNCYDFTILDNKKIIEFNGDYWHANPNKYNPEDIVYETVSAKDIWDRDETKNNIARDKRFEVLIVWESDYKKDRDICIEKCLKFLRS